MFKPIVRLTLATLLWKNYKKTIITTLVALLLLVFISFAHGDYVAFAQRTNDNSWLGFSFIAKWAMYLFIFLAWGWICFAPNKSNQQEDAKFKVSESSNISKTSNGLNDPFNEIRNKGKLRSRADMMVEKHKNI